MLRIGRLRVAFSRHNFTHVVANGTSATRRHLRSRNASSSAYDYVIVGGGSAGCVLASRLSQSPGVSVLLLEAGSQDTSPIFRIPLASVMYGTILSKKYNWSYFSAAEPYLNSRQVYQPRGKVLGGSGTINGMIWVRGHPEDYNEWSRITEDPSWNYTSMLHYFKKSEHASWVSHEDVDPTQATRGKGGPMHVEPTTWHHPISVAFLEACGQAGIAAAKDFNSGNNTAGSGFYELTTRNGQRMSTRHSYLPHEIISERSRSKQLTIVPDALVQNVEIANGQAVGVRYSRHGKSQTVEAKREIILSAGVFSSPQVLMLSGIGPAADLQHCGIPVLVDLPGVGENLQGHGLLTGNGVNAGGYIKSREDVAYEDLQLHFFPGSFREYKLSSLVSHSFSCNVYLSRPNSRGRLKLRSKDPSVYPEICFNYLADEGDRTVLIDGVRKVRDILCQSALDRYRGEELYPGSADSHEELLEFLRSNCKSAHHPTSTCRMGHSDDNGAVVDSELRVRGVSGLRVADASVMPTITTSNPYSSVIAIAERCADLVLQGR